MGIYKDFLDKVARVTKSDVKRKKMEVALYVKRMARNAALVEDMLMQIRKNQDLETPKTPKATKSSRGRKKLGSD
jgi:hypothetical protein